mmetsp:Transcript_23207/g.35837  ORF Transcript_23207/g.35837 Transcript_23207/m.35837 type:complete len:431 (-) Transcript_23207:239-1531(-)
MKRFYIVVHFGVALNILSPGYALQHHGTTSNTRPSPPQSSTSTTTVRVSALNPTTSKSTMNAVNSRRTFVKAVGTSLGLVATCASPRASTAAASTTENSSDSSFSSFRSNYDGLAPITDSDFGKLVRKNTIKGAQTFDSLDEKWERFSDGLRDKNKCDERTGRRMFDNGFRRDGTRVGNPVLGSMCKPIPLEPLDENGIARDMMQFAQASALKTSSSLSQKDIDDALLAVVNVVSPSFRKQLDNSAIGEEDRKRLNFNYAMYCQMRAFDNLHVAVQPFEITWGLTLLNALAPNADRSSYKSPFSTSSEDFGEVDVDASLLDALGALQVSLLELQRGGLIGKSEIAIPTDNFGSVITVAIDDDISLGSQILLKEQKKQFSSSFSTAMVKAALDRAHVSYEFDSFFLDPSTTKQSEYNPTQLLINISNVEKK